MRIKDEIVCFAHLRWCHNGWALNILIVVDTGYAGIHHSKYWMPIHYNTIEDGQNKQGGAILRAAGNIFAGQYLRATFLRANFCGPKFAGQNLRANICGPISAGQNLRANICGPKFAGQNLRANVCGPMFAGQNLRANIYFPEKWKMFH